MNLAGLSLTEVAAIVCERLRLLGIEAVVVGGSAVTVHVPSVYTSNDIDLAIVKGMDTRVFAHALKEMGFRKRGRDFVHPQTPYSVDLVAETPYIDQRPIRSYETVKTPNGTFMTYRPEDAIADRIAAWLHWSDSQALSVAERATAALAGQITWKRLGGALNELDASDPQTADRLKVARERLRNALLRKPGAES